MAGSRVHKSLLNAQVNLLFYFLTLILSFFSRKIFLDCLGADFIGLSGTLGNILGLLNLAELGIGTGISFFLYKPLQSENKEKIIEIMSVFGYLYRIIGTVIGIGGIMVSAFFPLIFREAHLGMGIIFFTFFSYLGSSLIGYFINYRQILLSADQKNYIVAAYFQSANIVKTLLQIALAYYYKNLYVWVSVEFLFGLISCIILNWKINKEYPWMKTHISQGKALLKNYPQILTNTRQIFVHKFKDFLLNRSDEILIFVFVSLKMVAYYGNYMIIASKLSIMVNMALDGVGAGVGHLVAEGNRKNTLKVFWELMSLRYFIAGIFIFSLYLLTEPFIVCWLGKEYLLSHTILILLLINLFIMQTRGAVDLFNHAHGLYADTWSAWAEGILNLSVTIAVATQYGIVGILLGKIVSTFLIIVFWKPYYLFDKGFQLPVTLYWKKTIRYYLVFLLTFTVACLASRFITINPADNFYKLILYGICTVPPFALCYFFLMFCFCPGMKDLINRIPFVRKILKR